MSYSDRQKIRPQTSPVRMPRKLSGGSLLTASFTDASVDANGIARPATSGTSMPNVVGGSLFPAVEGARPSTSPTRQMRTKAVMTSMAETTIDPSVDARPWTAQSMQGHDPITRSQSAMAVQLSPLMRGPRSAVVVCRGEATRSEILKHSEKIKAEDGSKAPAVARAACWKC